jgi:hypothetical protein
MTYCRQSFLGSPEAEGSGHQIGEAISRAGSLMGVVFSSPASTVVPF